MWYAMDPHYCFLDWLAYPTYLVFSENDLLHSYNLKLSQGALVILMGVHVTFYLLRPHQCAFHIYKINHNDIINF